MQQLQNIIETAFERRAEITPANADTVTREAVNQVIALLDSGALRVAEKIDGQWVTHQWLKKAVLLSFRINDNQVIEGAESRYFDKVPMKFADYDEARFQKEGFRVVPPAAVRQGVSPSIVRVKLSPEPQPPTPVSAPRRTPCGTSGRWRLFCNASPTAVSASRPNWPRAGFAASR